MGLHRQVGMVFGARLPSTGYQGPFGQQVEHNPTKEMRKKVFVCHSYWQNWVFWGNKAVTELLISFSNYPPKAKGAAQWSPPALPWGWELLLLPCFSELYPWIHDLHFYINLRKEALHHFTCWNYTQLWINLFTLLKYPAQTDPWLCPTLISLRKQRSSGSRSAVCSLAFDDWAATRDSLSFLQLRLCPTKPRSLSPAGWGEAPGLR